MAPIQEYFPWYAWIAVVLCASVAAAPLFLTPSAVGLSLSVYVAAVAAVEFLSAVAIGALVVYYRDGAGDSEEETSEWRFEP